MLISPVRQILQTGKLLQANISIPGKTPLQLDLGSQEIAKVQIVDDLLSLTAYKDQPNLFQIGYTGGKMPFGYLIELKGGTIEAYELTGIRPENRKQLENEQKAKVLCYFGLLADHAITTAELSGSAIGQRLDILEVTQWQITDDIKSIKKDLDNERRFAQEDPIR